MAFNEHIKSLCEMRGPEFQTRLNLTCDTSDLTETSKSTRHRSKMELRHKFGKNTFVVDMRVFDKDGMLDGVGDAVVSQCQHVIPSTALGVLQANAEAGLEQSMKQGLTYRMQSLGNNTDGALSTGARTECENAASMLDPGRVKLSIQIRAKQELSDVDVQKKYLQELWKRRQVAAVRPGFTLGKNGVHFSFESHQLPADQKWEGIHHYGKRTTELSLAPEDPGDPNSPRPLVKDISPFFKYGFLPALHKLYLQRVSGFYTPKRLANILAPLVNQEDETALRQLDWLVTNYCKEYNLCVVGQDGKQRHVYSWYIALRETLTKRHFEPFGKKWRVAFRVNGKIYHTTAGQAVFVMEAYKAGVLQYAKEHCAQIDLHLRRQHRRRDRRKKVANGTYKRGPLTPACGLTTTIVKEDERALENVNCGTEKDFMKYLRKRRRVGVTKNSQ